MRSSAMTAEPLDLCSQSRQHMGEVEEEDALFSLALRRVHYDMDQSSDNRLLWRAKVEKSVRAGSLARLVRQLAPLEEEVSVSAYRTCFLATYRTFASAVDVLSHVTDWYLALSTTGDTPPAEADTKRRAQMYLLAFLRLWLDQYPTDFQSPELSQLTVFLQEQQQQQSCCPQEIIDLLHYLESLPTVSPALPRSKSIQSLEPTKTFDLYTLTPQQFAEALTAKDAALFRAVQPHQCLHQIRQQQKKAASVQACIERFNRVSLIVISTVLQPPTCHSMQEPAHIRGTAINRWISIAHQCRLLKNFSSLKAIVSSLESSAVFRLARSWAAVPNNQLGQFRDLQQLFSHEHNHQASRDILNKEGTGKHVVQVSPARKRKPHSRVTLEAVHGVVPYLGTFLTDLTMIHSAYPDHIKGGLINFEKRRMEFEVLAKMSLFQAAATQYSYTSSIEFEHWLETTAVLSEQESYEFSRSLEGDSSSKPDSRQCQAILRKTLQLIAGKGVADSSSSRGPSPSSRGPSPSQRGPSPCPSIDSKQWTDREQQGEEEDSYIVRVSASNSDTCNYKSIMLSKADRTTAVVKASLEKFALPGPATNYQLTQVMQEGGLVIPEGASVYYALMRDGSVPQLRLQLKK